MTTSTTFSPAAQMQADLSRVAQDLQLRRVHVEAVVQLLDEGNTVPFITRYRKERTGGMNEELIRRIQQRVTQLRQLNERKQTILRTIENQGQLTPELRQAILAADSPKRLEDLYLPYKPKKRSFASEAREKGLEPFALAIWNRDPVAIPLHDVAQGMVNPDKGLNSVEDVLTGARNILAEIISEQADLRGAVRKWLWDNAQITATRHEHLPPGKGQEFKGYFEFKESLQSIPPHRILAINRGERENVLKIRLEYNTDEVRSVALSTLPLLDHPHRDFLEATVGEALSRLLLPGLEREIRRELTDFAMDHAISVFARNLRGLLLQPPLRGKRILAIDPGLRAGCKLAALDEYGNLLHHDVIYPHPINRREEAFRKAESRLKLEEIIRKYQLSVIAIGNGTACRETEKLIADLITDLESRQFTGEPKIELPPQEMESPAASQPSSTEAPATPAPTTATPAEPTSTASDGEKSTLPPNPAVEETANAPENAGVSPTPPVSETEGFVDKTGFVDTPTPGAGTAVQATETVPSVVENSATPGETSPTPVEAAVTPVAENSATPGETSPTPVEAAVTPVVENSATPGETTPTPVEAAVTPVAAGGVVAAPKREPKPLPTLPKIDFSSLPPAPSDLAYCIVNEAGASDYSASEMAREEFPELDAMVRGVISIGRRLQDPLAELVKIDPAHIGVGLYQHDIKPKHLRETLDAVIESCVNHVGVDLNTASVALLRYVSGFNALVAREVVEYRKQHGPFRTREQLQNVPGVGPARFTQAAGFLKIPGGDEPLDETWIHPESYPIARKILEDVGMTPNDLRDAAKLNELREKLKKVHPEVYAEKFQAGVPTVKDIFEALAKPSRDPRDELPPPVFRKNVLRLEDLQPGMELRGTVLNVVDFGVFVDVGLKDSGLVHISQMANRFIKNPYDVVSVNDVVTVWVRSVDLENKRVSLTMIPPGTERRPPGSERRPPERRGAPAEGASEGRPAREPRRGGPPRQRAAGPPRSDAPASGPPSGPHRGGPPSGGRPRGRGPHDRLDRRPAAPTASPPASTSGSTPEPVAESPTSSPPSGSSSPPASPPRPANQPRRPLPRPKPLPKLTKEAMSGKSPLFSFGELAAFFKAKEMAAEASSSPAETAASTPTDSSITPPSTTEPETSVAPPSTTEPEASVAPPSTAEPESSVGSEPTSPPAPPPAAASAEPVSESVPSAESPGESPPEAPSIQ